jgi:hypothetical protein
MISLIATSQVFPLAVYPFHNAKATEKSGNPTQDHRRKLLATPTSPEHHLGKY